MNIGFGRLKARDTRDANYPIRAVIPRRVTRTSRYWYDRGAWWDQKSSGTCVGHAWAHWLADGPVTHRRKFDPFHIYDEATEVDEWTGNEGDRDFGTSVRAGAKVLHDWGLVGEYRWADSVDSVVRALLEVGPVVMGTNWYGGMVTPDGEGLIRINSPADGVLGGHAYLLTGVSVTRELVRVKNSWGRGWGKDGRAWLSLDDLSRLIHEDGEACLATEKRVVG